MILKPAQTMISNSRATMLRQHYHNGHRADATIKRLLASSTFNEDKLVSDEIELAALYSTVTSALELSEHPNTCLLFKWYKVFLLSMRTFAALFPKDRTDSFLIGEKLSNQIYTMLIEPKAVKDEYSIIKDRKVTVSYRNLVELIDNKVRDSTRYAKEIAELLNVKIPNTNVQFQLKLMEYFYYLILSDEALFEMLITKLILPSSLVW